MHGKQLLNEAMFGKSLIEIFCPRCADSIFWIQVCLGQLQQANDAVSSQRSIFSENRDYKC